MSSRTAAYAVVRERLERGQTVVLDGGMKLTEGKPEEVRRNEQVLAAYLGSAGRPQRDAAAAADDA